MKESSSLERISGSRCFDGEQLVFSHLSAETGTRMRFGIYLPAQARSRKVPVLYWLSGLTCTEDNFVTKAGAQRMASQLGLAVAQDAVAAQQLAENGHRSPFGGKPGCAPVDAVGADSCKGGAGKRWTVDGGQWTAPRSALPPPPPLAHPRSHGELLAPSRTTPPPPRQNAPHLLSRLRPPGGRRRA